MAGEEWRQAERKKECDRTTREAADMREGRRERTEGGSDEEGEEEEEDGEGTSHGGSRVVRRAWKASSAWGRT